MSYTSYEKYKFKRNDVINVLNSYLFGEKSSQDVREKYNVQFLSDSFYIKSKNNKILFFIMGNGVLRASLEPKTNNEFTQMSKDLLPALEKTVINKNTTTYDVAYHDYKLKSRSPKVITEYGDLVYNQGISKLVDHILENPCTLELGNKRRSDIIKNAGLLDSGSTNNDFLRFVRYALSYYNHNVFHDLLKDTVKKSKKNYATVLMWYQPNKKIQWFRFFKKFSGSGKIEFYDIENLRKFYTLITSKIPNLTIKKEYFADFTHFCLYVIEHEIAHALNIATLTKLDKANNHDARFWAILQAFSGEYVAGVLAQFISRPTMEELDFINNPELGQTHYEYIRDQVLDFGMIHAREGEILAQQIFQAAIAMY